MPGRPPAITYAAWSALYIVQDDPSNDKFLDGAVALQAAYVIAGDARLLGIKRYVDLQIISLQDFMRRVAPKLSADPAAKAS